MLSLNGRSSMIEMNINRYIGKNVKDKQEPKLHFIHMFDGIIAFLVFDNLFPEDINIFLRKAYSALKYDGKSILICSISELETAKAHQRNLHKQGIPAILGEIIENGVYQFKPPLNVIESIIRRSGFVIEDCTFENTYTAFITIQKGII
jgi:cyclopropane fatty-acyl-phospholipid synthase-like methyltransferase